MRVRPVAVVLPLLLAACGAAPSSSDSVQTIEPLISSSVHVLNVQPGVNVDVESDSLIFDSPAAPDVEARDVGDIVVSANGTGFLRRVTGRTEQDGKLTFQTENAALGDVFEQAQVESPLTTTDSTSSDTLRPSSFGLTLPALQVQNVQVPIGSNNGTMEIVNGSFAFNPTLDLDVVIRKGTVQTFTAIARGTVNASIDVKYNVTRPGYVGDGVTLNLGQPGVPIAELPPQFFVLWVGAVPVVVAVKAQLLAGYLIEVGGDASGEEIVTGSGSVQVGTRYDGSFHDQSSASLSVSAGGPASLTSTTFGGDFTLTAKVSVSFYDLAGPYVALQAYAGVGRDSGTAASASEDPSDLYGEIGVRGLVGVQAGPFGPAIVGYQSVLFDEGIHVPLVGLQ